MAPSQPSREQTQLAGQHRIIQRQLDFLSRNVTTPKGTPFSVKGREEFIFWYFNVLNGWQIGKNVEIQPKRDSTGKIETDSLLDEYLDAHVCDSCADKLGELTMDFSYKYDCPEPGCVGLKAHNIWMVLLHADRRVGKTFTTCAFAVERLCKGKNWRGKYIASGEKHTQELSEENLEGIVKRNASDGDGRIDKALTVLKGRSLANEHRNNKLTLSSTSGAANLGAGLALVIVDEAKAVSFNVFNKLLPSLQEMHGWNCTACGWQYTGRMDPEPERCPSCGKSNHGVAIEDRTLVPWNARAVVCSNAGTIEGDPVSDWFDHAVDSFLKHPNPNVVVGRFDDNAATNPDVNPQVKYLALDLINRIPGLEEHTNEWTNEAQSVGKPFAPEHEHIYIDHPAESWPNVEKPIYDPVIAFVDVARTTDLVSITVWKDASRSTAWDAVETVYCEYWDPQNPDNGISTWKPGENKGKGQYAVEWRLLGPVLDRILRRFPNIQLCWVDTRMLTLAQQTLEYLRAQGAPYSGVTLAYEGKEEERAAAYVALDTLVTTDRIRTFRIKRLELEWQKAVWVPAGRFMTVRERGKSNNAKQRRKNHLDILEGHATLALMAFELRENAGNAANIVQSGRGIMGNNQLGKGVPKVAAMHDGVDTEPAPANAAIEMLPPSVREKVGGKPSSRHRRNARDRARRLDDF